MSHSMGSFIADTWIVITTLVCTMFPAIFSLRWSCCIVEVQKKRIIVENSVVIYNLGSLHRPYCFCPFHHCHFLCTSDNGDGREDGDDYNSNNDDSNGKCHSMPPWMIFIVALLARQDINSLQLQWHEWKKLQGIYLTLTWNPTHSPAANKMIVEFEWDDHQHSAPILPMIPMASRYNLVIPNYFFSGYNPIIFERKSWICNHHRCRLRQTQIDGGMPVFYSWGSETSKKYDGTCHYSLNWQGRKRGLLCRQITGLWRTRQKITVMIEATAIINHQHSARP